MQVLLKLSTTLRACVPDYDPFTGLAVTLADGSCVEDLARQLNIPLKDIKIAMVNGRQAELDTVLQDKDRVALFPAVGGG